MTPLQEKAINEAMRLLDTVTGQPFYANNYDTIAQMRDAAATQRLRCDQDSAAKSQAMGWLRAALKS